MVDLSTLLHLFIRLRQLDRDGGGDSVACMLKAMESMGSICGWARRKARRTLLGGAFREVALLAVLVIFISFMELTRDGMVDLGVYD